jgi:hypothetical protein
MFGPKGVGFRPILSSCEFRGGEAPLFHVSGGFSRRGRRYPCRRSVTGAVAPGTDEGVRPYVDRGGLLDQRASVAVGFFFWRDYYRSGYAVAWFQLEETDTLGVAAGFADRRRVHADDFAVVADQHDF